MAGSKDIRALTGNDQLSRWNASEELGTPVVVTFSFSTKKPGYDTVDRSGFTAFSEAQKDAAREALDIWAEKTGLTFLEVSQSTGGQIRFAKVNMDGQTNATGGPVKGYGYFPGYGYLYVDGNPTIVPVYDTLGGDVFMNAETFNGSGTMNPGTAGFSILLHEIGHAIGFKHPFEGKPTLSPSKDHGDYTVMSYNRSNSTTELGSLDIEAAQLYYGKKSFKYSFNEKTKVLKLQGTSKNDVILGTELNDVINGRGGKDKLIGSVGDDKLNGGKKADMLIGGDGNDKLVGGKGNDKLYGDLGNDKLNGGAGKDKLFGGEGNDKLNGGAGKDELFGGGGDDVLKGGKGKDRLDGGAGADTLVGGKGKDTFVFSYVSGDNSTDRIKDFDASAGDRIDLTSYGKAWSGAQPFQFIGDAAFSGAQGELRYETVGRDTFVYGDLWGGATSDLSILLLGVSGVKESDFIL